MTHEETFHDVHKNVLSICEEIHAHNREISMALEYRKQLKKEGFKLRTNATTYMCSVVDCLPRSNERKEMIDHIESVIQISELLERILDGVDNIRPTEGV